MLGRKGLGEWGWVGFLMRIRIWALKIVSFVFYSVADPGCLSRIPDREFYSSGFSDPGSRSASLVFIIFFRILIIDICLGGSIRSARGGWGDDWGDDWGRVL